MPLTRNDLMKCKAEDLLELQFLTQMFDASPIAEREYRKKAVAEKAKSLGLSTSTHDLMEADFNGVFNDAIEAVTARETT